MTIDDEKPEGGIDKHKIWGIFGFIIVMIVILLLVSTLTNKEKKGIVGHAVGTGLKGLPCVNEWYYADKDSNIIGDIHNGCEDVDNDGKPWCATKTVIKEGKNLYIAQNGEGTEWDYCKEDTTTTKKVQTIEPPKECSDTDDGQNYFIAGETKHPGYAFVLKDFCEGEKVTEYSCNGVELIIDKKKCSSFGKEYICKDGACVKPDCTDSDEGLDYFVAGETHFFGNLNIYKDSCELIDNIKWLTEYSCKDDQVFLDKKKCSSFGKEYICENGACTKEITPPEPKQQSTTTEKTTSQTESSQSPSAPPKTIQSISTTDIRKNIITYSDGSTSTYLCNEKGTCTPE